MTLRVRFPDWAVSCVLKHDTIYKIAPVYSASDMCCDVTGAYRHLHFLSITLMARREGTGMHGRLPLFQRQI